MPHTHATRLGFTLIELSIVLVIIALIVGGILVGRDMIHTSQIRSQVAQLEQLQSAVNTFRLKYSCLPGDCDATRFLAGVSDGGNDGALNNGDEFSYFWEHLSASLLIEGIYDGNSIGRIGVNTPPAKLPGHGYSAMLSSSFNAAGGLAVFSSSTYGIDDQTFPDGIPLFFIGATLVGYLETFGVYYGIDMYALDIKIDDGKPFTGVMQGSNYIFGSSGTTHYTSGVGEASCIDDTSSDEPLYNISQNLTLAAAPTNGVCGVFMKMIY